MAFNNINSSVEALPETIDESLPKGQSILGEITTLTQEPELIYRPNGGFDGIEGMDIDELIPMSIRYLGTVRDKYTERVFQTFCYYIDLKRDEVLRRYNSNRKDLEKIKKSLKEVTDPIVQKQLQSQITDIEFLSQNIEVYWEQTAKEA